MTKFGLTSGKFNRRVIFAKQLSEDFEPEIQVGGKKFEVDYTDAGTKYERKFVRWCQVFLKKQTVPIEAGGVSDKQEYLFNVRKDTKTKEVSQRWMLTYREQDYNVLNVDDFNEGIRSITACKRQ